MPDRKSRKRAIRLEAAEGLLAPGHTSAQPLCAATSSCDHPHASECTYPATWKRDGSACPPKSQWQNSYFQLLRRGL